MNCVHIRPQKLISRIVTWLELSGYNKKVKILQKEVIKMKKIIMIVMAFAFVAAFASLASAGDTAQLNLTVTFANDPILERILQLKARVTELEQQAKTEYERAVASGDHSVIDVAIHNLLEIRDSEVSGVRTELRLIFVEYADPWGQIQPILDEITRFTDTLNDYLKKLQDLLPVIAIELEGPNPWVLQGVKLGEKRSNMSASGSPAHAVKNTGNVPASIDVGYGPQIQILPCIHPGLEQGPDTFITIAAGMVIPPDRKVPIPIETIGLNPGASVPLNLVYGAPTGLSKGFEGMEATYEVRAFSAVIAKS